MEKCHPSTERNGIGVESRFGNEAKLNVELTLNNYMVVNFTANIKKYF